MSAQKFPVAEPTTLYKAMVKVWLLVDTLWGGTDAMRAARTTYLPQEPKETNPAYENRIAKSVLTPLYQDTIRKLMGKIMRMPVVLEDDVKPEILRFMDDVDSEGTDINEWVKRLGESALNHGVTYVLVDIANPDKIESETGQRPTRDDVVRGKLRPYAVHIKAPQVLGWKYSIIDGRTTLTQFRVLWETEEDSTEDEFSTEEVKRIHVWEIGRLRIYRLRLDDNNNEEWFIEEDLPTDLDIIPVIPIYGYQISFMQGVPPLIDVAHLNIAHWQSDSDQRHILHVARVPLLFGSGLGDTDRGDFEVQVGPNTMTRGPQGSDMKYVEHTGAGIESGEADLNNIEAKIAKLGLNMVIRRQTGDVTATSRALDQAETDSPLGMFARHLEDKMEDMLDLFAMLMNLGEDAGGSVTVFKDFTISARDADDVKAFGEMRTRGDLSQRTYWEELKRRGMLSDDFDPEVEIGLLDVEFIDGSPGITGDEDDLSNKVGDETEAVDGHTHILQANGFTNIVGGHRHEWNPSSEETTFVKGHKHPLKRGIKDGDSSTRQQEKSAPATGEGGEDDQ